MSGGFIITDVRYDRAGIAELFTSKAMADALFREASQVAKAKTQQASGLVRSSKVKPRYGAKTRKLSFTQIAYVYPANEAAHKVNDQYHILER